MAGSTPAMTKNYLSQTSARPPGVGPGGPRLPSAPRAKTGMAGTSPAMTKARICIPRFTGPKPLLASLAPPCPPGKAMLSPTQSFALDIRGLSKRFDRPAVDGLDLQVRTGEFYALVGPNGAGKTTTLRMVAGLLKPDAGSIEIAGI